MDTAEFWNWISVNRLDLLDAGYPGQRVFRNTRSAGEGWRLPSISVKSIDAKICYASGVWAHRKWFSIWRPSFILTINPGPYSQSTVHLCSYFWRLHCVCRMQCVIKSHLKWMNIYFQRKWKFNSIMLMLIRKLGESNCINWQIFACEKPLIEIIFPVSEWILKFSSDPNAAAKRIYE